MRSTDAKIIIGITGTLGAGKGAIVEHLKKHSFAHHSAREYLTKKIHEQMGELNRDAMVALADRLRINHGPSFMMEELMREAQKHEFPAVIESVRTIGEVEYLRTQKNFILFAVDADPKIRFDRIRNRRSETDRVTFEKFLEDEARESEGNEPWKGNLPRCISTADFIFTNNSTKEKLFSQINNALARLGFLT